MIEHIRYSLNEEESNIVRKTMKQKKITNKQIAKIMGLSLPYINQFVLGNRTFNIEQIQQFGIILDINLLGNIR